MGKYIGRKVLQSVAVLVVSSLLLFFAMRLLPGSIAYSLYGANAQRLTAAEIERLEVTLLGNTPLLEQYFYWLMNIFQGQWGYSFSQQQAVSLLMAELALPTIVIVLLALLFTNFLITGFVILIQAQKGKFLSKIVEAFLFLTTIVPGFWIGFLLLWVFAVIFKWFPVYGSGDGSFMSLLYHTILPSLSLSIPAVFYGVKLIQENLQVVKQQPFLIQIKKRGITGVRYMQHLFPHIALVFLQLNGYFLTAFLGGTIAVETVFSFPGLGRLTVEATKAHDYPTLMMILLIGLFFILVLQLIIDVISSLIDPRVYKSLRE